MILNCLKLVSLPFLLACLCFDICLWWSCFLHGSRWCCKMDL